MPRFQKEMTQARLELATFRGGHCECEANVITNYTIEPMFHAERVNWNEYNSWRQMLASRLGVAR